MQAAGEPVDSDSAPAVRKCAPGADAVHGESPNVNPLSRSLGGRVLWMNCFQAPQFISLRSAQSDELLSISTSFPAFLPEGLAALGGARPPQSASHAAARRRRRSKANVAKGGGSEAAVPVGQAGPQSWPRRAEALSRALGLTTFSDDEAAAPRPRPHAPS